MIIKFQNIFSIKDIVPKDWLYDLDCILNYNLARYYRTLETIYLNKLLTIDIMIGYHY